MKNPEQLNESEKNEPTPEMTPEQPLDKAEAVDAQGQEPKKPLEELKSEQAIKDQKELVETRRSLGLETTSEKPKRNYIEVVIDNDFMRKNLLPDGGLRMKGGQANWKGEVDLMKYVISEDLSPEYRQTALDKIKKLEVGQEKVYEHEAHHIQNRENELAPHVAAKSLREYLTFRVLDEMSAFVSGGLTNQKMTAESFLQALQAAEKNIADSYYGKPFSDDADWYMSQHGNEPGALVRKIDPDMYHKIMRQYFKINGQDALSALQREKRMPEFTEAINRLILNLDSLLETRNVSKGKK